MTECDKLQKLIDESFSKALKGEISPEEYFEIRKQWTDFINKQNN